MLVLQWPASGLSDYDSLIEIEHTLEACITGDASVDGHDMGSGEMNIFLETNDPLMTFDEVQAAVSSSPRWVGLRAAYSEVDGSEYTVLWPHGLTTFRVT